MLTVKRFMSIEADNPRTALALDGLFTEKVSRLVDHPSIGRLGRMPGTRELVAHQNYIIVYDVTADNIRILRILHAARQWPVERVN